MGAAVREQVTAKKLNPKWIDTLTRQVCCSTGAEAVAAVKVASCGRLGWGSVPPDCLDDCLDCLHLVDMIAVLVREHGVRSSHPILCY